ncbi:MAG: thiamine phosphate synthase [Planctomycetota bacterium]|jgi:thiamine-phosphate pyrophosphorylase
MIIKESLHGVRLYVLIDSNIATKSVEETARFVIDGGADAIQLREKTISDGEFISLAREIHDMTAQRGTLLIINDRVEVAKEVNAEGVHLGQQDIGISEARDVIGNEKIIGVSTHNIEQARQAQKEGADYIAIGPAYPTHTKIYEPPVGLEVVQEIAREISIPFVVIGAITLKNLDEVLKTGATMVAVCSAIISSRDITSSTRQFKDKLTLYGH